jgi:hypothetical protein
MTQEKCGKKIISKLEMQRKKILKYSVTHKNANKIADIRYLL